MADARRPGVGREFLDVVRMRFQQDFLRQQEQVLHNFEARIIAPQAQPAEPPEDPPDYIPEAEDDDYEPLEAGEEAGILHLPEAVLPLEEQLNVLAMLREKEPCYKLLQHDPLQNELLYQAGEMLLHLDKLGIPRVQHRAGEMWFEADGVLAKRIEDRIQHGFYANLRALTDEVENRQAAIEQSKEALRQHHSSFVLWGLRMPDLEGQLKGLEGIQGVEKVFSDPMGIELRLAGFTSRIDVPGEGWLDCEIDARLHASEKIVVASESRLIIPKLGCYVGMPIVNRRGNYAICLDAGEVNYTMAMRAADPVQALLGVLAQLRSLDNNGYTKNEEFVREGQTCGECGSRVRAKSLLATRGRACEVCSSPCPVCLKPLSGNEATSTAMSGWIHVGCRTECRGCMRQIGKGMVCPDCGPGPEPAQCSKCKGTANPQFLRIFSSPREPNRMELRCPECTSECSYCNNLMAIPEKKSITRCLFCRKKCVVCGVSVPGRELRGDGAHMECLVVCRSMRHYARYFRMGALDRDGKPAENCAGCSKVGFWVPLRRSTKAQSGAEEASQNEQAREEE